MSLLDLVQQQLGAGGTQQIADQIGADPSTTQNAIQAALPMLLGGMAGAAREPGGASALSGLLGQSGGMGGLGGVLGSVLGGGGLGGGMLGGLLGGHHDAVQDGVQQASGLSGDQTKKLLMILAPIAIAAIAHQRQQARQQVQPGGQAASGAVMEAGAGGAADLDGDGIPDYMEQEARQAQAQSNSHVGGLIGKILDLGARPAR